MATGQGNAPTVVARGLAHSKAYFIADGQVGNALNATIRRITHLRVRDDVGAREGARAAAVGEIAHLRFVAGGRGDVLSRYCIRSLIR